MKFIEAITLDLDDTLWAIEPVIVEAERHVYQWLSINCSRATDKYNLEDMQEIRAEVSAEFPEYGHDLSELRRLTFKKILQSTGYAEYWVESVFEEFMTMRNKVELYPDVLPALEKLAGLFSIASISNGNADLNRIGIEHHFNATISAREHGVAKPHRDLFFAACDALQCDPDNVLHIGDHPEHDVLGAANAGLKTVWLNRRGDPWPHQETADVEAKDLNAVLRLLNVHPC